MDGMGWGDIIFFGAIAAFIFLRYRAMLGEQHGRDEEEIKRDQAARASEYERVIQLPQQAAAKRDAENAASKRPQSQEYGTALKARFKEMQQIDASFDIEDFKDGAKAAFEMVIEAFNDADKPTLKNLLARDIYNNFDAVLQSRARDATYPHTTLVAINEATVTDAALDGKTAHIHVTFTSEQIQQIKARDGSDAANADHAASQIETVEDAWVFTRNLASSDPSWAITQT
jgi:predicted lipid-binding transport protein (Tim44 family)